MKPKEIIYILLVFIIYSCDNGNRNNILEATKRLDQLDNETKEVKESKTISRNKLNSSNKLPKKDINETNIFSIKVENDGFFDIEIPKYTVVIKRTADLNGKYVYDSEKKDTHSNGFFGSDIVFYTATYGYYTVEYYGFDKYDRKVFHKKFSNVLHKCHTVGTFYTNTDWNSPNVYCF